MTVSPPSSRLRLTRQVGSVTLVLRCEAELKEKAEWALAGLAELKEGPLVDGKVIRFGWSAFTLVAQGSELVVHEPDFGGNPRAGLRDDVSLSLRVQGQLLGAARTAGVEPQLPAFHETIAAQPQWLEAPWLLMARRLRPEVASTGWLIAAKDAPAVESSALVQLAMWQLVHARPALVGLLALPPGAQVIVEGDTIRQIELPKPLPR